MDLSYLQVNSAKFLRSFVTQDETWLHHFDPKSKNQSKLWKHTAQSKEVASVFRE